MARSPLRTIRTRLSRVLASSSSSSSLALLRGLPARPCRRRPASTATYFIIPRTPPCLLQPPHYINALPWGSVLTSSLPAIVSHSPIPFSPSPALHVLAKIQSRHLVSSLPPRTSTYTSRQPSARTRACFRFTHLFRVSSSSGGGIGGLISALTLSRHPDIQVDVYEAAKEFAEIGAGIGVWPRAWKILQSLGLEEDLAQAAVVRPTNLPSRFYASFNAFRADCFFPRGSGVAFTFRKGDQPLGLSFNQLITPGKYPSSHTLRRSCIPDLSYRRLDQFPSTRLPTRHPQASPALLPQTHLKTSRILPLRPCLLVHPAAPHPPTLPRRHVRGMRPTDRCRRRQVRRAVIYASRARRKGAGRG